MCAANRITRADVLCELVRALLSDRAPAARKTERGLPGPPALSPKESIMRALRRSGSMTVRELKRTTNSKRVSVDDWDRALRDLIVSGTLNFHLGGKTGLRKVVSLPEISGAAQPENAVKL